MKFYYEPVNLNQWNMFEKVKSIGHIEPFLATKSMKIGDIVFLHVGSQNKDYQSGIYALGEVVRAPYVLEGSSQDYCNNKNTVDVEIKKINYSTPYITHGELVGYIKQFRTVHNIDDEYGKKLLKIIDESTYRNKNIVTCKKYDTSTVVEKDLSQADSKDLEGQAGKTDIVKELEGELDTLGIKGEERRAYIKVRVNQSVFREKLLQRYNNCCLCKVEHTALLKASHIKPWAESSDKEKLDVENGLLLCPNHDALFDGGFISFDDSGKILISDRLTQIDRIFMNVIPDMKIKLTERNKVYMDYHRKNIFK